MYDAELDGTVRNFGTSGFLFNSNKLMYDRATLSMWHSLTGEPVVGKLANSGLELELLPLVLTTWEEWLAENPDTTVLTEDQGFNRRYPDDAITTKRSLRASNTSRNASPSAKHDRGVGPDGPGASRYGSFSESSRRSKS